MEPVPVNSPHKGQWREALMFSLICARINDWVNNREASDLRRHRGHFDVNLMVCFGLRHGTLQARLPGASSSKIGTGNVCYTTTPWKSATLYYQRRGCHCLRKTMVTEMQYRVFLHDRPWISPWIKSISNELDIISGFSTRKTWRCTCRKGPAGVMSSKPAYAVALFTGGYTSHVAIFTSSQ